MVHVQVRDRLRTFERVGTTVCAVDQPVVGPPLAVVTANAAGVANLGAVPDGIHTLTVTAPHSERGDVGPGDVGFGDILSLFGF